ncbi:MAG TPA: TonB-dependent receptor [Longimicrobiales bacterium]|nr:TonB-dependent receptor [Longimicrobiales bacterium]
MRLSNGIRWLAVAAFLAMSGELAAQSTASLVGRVTDDNGAGVSGVQVVVTNQNSGTQNGALSQSDGRFTVVGLRAGGPYRVEARMIGYGLMAVDDVMLAAGQTRTVDFRLTQEAVAIDAIEVFATRAIERKTPVAYTDVPKVQIQNQLGSQDLPMVLNVTPSVYATMQGGGAGDARINVRGFDQKNTAVMINGVPVNDMENGWVYWSNWDGLGDAAQGIQLQRGLSAVNLATPSIGGTMNVITDPSSMRGGVSYKQEFGTANFLKETFSVSSGERDGFAVTANLVRKTGDGRWANGDALATWTDAWAYYLAAAYQINPKNRLEFYAVGAPQSHGQNLYKLNLATMDQDFARELGFEQAALDWAGAEAGRFWSPNVAPVSSSYAGQRYASTGPQAGTNPRYDPNFINERENYFHKPQVNLNYYSYFGNGLTWSTVAYYSGGRGGGSGTLGSSSAAAWDYTYKQRVPDWDGTIAKNRARANGSSGFILRSSVNNQDTWGAISKLRKDYQSGWTTEVGLDVRTAEISHYRDVRDLLGGAYWTDTRNAFTGSRNTGPGDRIDYSNTNTVHWLGAYLQTEKSSSDGSIYGMFGWANNSYTFVDDFKKGSGPDGKLQLESGGLSGYQIKGGVSRNLTDEWSLFGNAGYVSKVPIFDGVIDDVRAVLNPDPKNERFVSVEGGVSFRAQDRGLSFDGNFYYTTWKDRTQNIYVENEDILVNVLGVDARHMGVEFQSAYQPNELVRFDAALSFGNWTYLDDATGFAVSGDRQTSTEYSFYIKDLKVSDQPQTQFAYAASLYPVDGMFLQMQGRSNFNYYAAFSPFGRTDATDRAQPWKTPSYTVFDFHGAYRISDLLPMLGGGDVRLFANVFNVFDTRYIQDATDNSGFNGYHADGDRHDADSAEVYLGLPRMYNIGFQIIF